MPQEPTADSRRTPANAGPAGPGQRDRLRSSSSNRMAANSLVTRTSRNPPCSAPRIASALPRHGQSRWAASLRDRGQPASGSTVSVLDALADGAQARRRPASPRGLELRFPHAREQIHEIFWCGATGFEPVTLACKTHFPVAGRRLVSPEGPVSCTDRRWTSPRVAWGLPPLAPRWLPVGSPEN